MEKQTEAAREKETDPKDFDNMEAGLVLGSLASFGKEPDDLEGTAKAAAELKKTKEKAGEKLAAEKLAAEKLAIEKLAIEKLAAEKLAEKLAIEKLAIEKLAIEKLAAEKLAAAEQQPDTQTARIVYQNAVDAAARAQAAAEEIIRAIASGDAGEGSLPAAQDAMQVARDAKEAANGLKAAADAAEVAEPQQQQVLEDLRKRIETETKDALEQAASVAKGKEAEMKEQQEKEKEKEQGEHNFKVFGVLF